MGGRFASGVWRLMLVLAVALAPLASHSQTTTTTYTYDAMGRLVGVQDRVDDVETRPVTYRYDAAGNRTDVVTGGAYREYPVKVFTSSSGTGPGLTPRGMADGRIGSADSVHVTGVGAGAWIAAELEQLGGNEAIYEIDLAPAAVPDVDAGALNGSVLQWSADGVDWKPTEQPIGVLGVPNSRYMTFDIGGQKVRFFRVYRPGAGPLALGEFRIFGGAAPGGAPDPDRPPISTPDADLILTTERGYNVAVRPHLVVSQGVPPFSTDLPCQNAPVGLTAYNNDYNHLTFRSDVEGLFQFTCNVRDATGTITPVRVAVSVVPQGNHPPIALPDEATTYRDIPVTFNPVFNDVDADNEAVHLVSVQIPQFSGQATWDVNTGQVTYRPSFWITGRVDLTYVIADARGLEATGRIQVTVNERPVNGLPPTAVDDSRAVTLNTPITFRPQANDTDPDADALFVQSVTQPAHGGVTINNGGESVTYTPAGGYLGLDGFDYVLIDARGLTDTAHVNLSVSTQANRNPTPGDDAFSPDFGTTTGFTYPLANDTDPDGDDLKIVSVTNGAHGRVELFPQLAFFIYYPDVDWVGIDTFTYTVSDGRGGTGVATVSATTKPPPNNNFPPTLNPDSLSVMSNKATVLDPRVNDTDREGDPIVIGSVSSPEFGQAVVNAGSSISYTPLPGFVGNDRFYYGSQGRFARVDINVLPNEAPTAVDDTLNLLATERTVTFDPRVNDTDPEANALTVTLVTSPAHGTASVAPQGAGIVYTPDPLYGGADSVQYTISDGWGGTSSATITINVPANGVPTAATDTLKVATGARIVIDPRTNDVDPDNDPLVISTVTSPSNGAVAIVNSNGAIAYRSAPNFTGSDSFTYSIADGRGGVATGTVNVTVFAPRVFAIQPAVEGKSTWNLDFDGPLNLGTNGTWTITPQSTFQAPIKAWGAAGGPSKTGDVPGFGGAGGYASGEVTLQQDVSYRLIVGQGGGSGFELGAPYGMVGGGQLFPGSGGSLTGVHRSSDLLSILIAGGGGGAGWGGHGGAGGGVGNGQTGTTVSGGGAPGGGGGQATPTGQMQYGGQGSGDYGGGGGGGYNGGGGGAGVRDVHNGGGGGGGGSSYAHPSHVSTALLMGGDLLVAGNANDPDRAGAGQPTQVFDSRSVPGRLIIVGPAAQASGGPNGSPVAVDDSIVVRQDAALTFAPLANDNDPDLDVLSVTGLGVPAHGAAVVPAGKQVTYTPALGYLGADSFTYTIDDGRGGSDTANVSVNVVGNTAPSAAADSVTANAGSAKTIDPRSNDTDGDGDALTIITVTQPLHGTVSFTGALVTYTAVVSYTGSDSFTYTVSDGFGGTATGTVSVTVTAPQRIFAISPAVGGKTTWNLDVDGPLDLATPGTWTLTPQFPFSAAVNAWGAGGGGANPSRTERSNGGGGGFAGGTLALEAGETVSIIVGGGGGNAGAAGYGGGGAGSGAYAGGGGGRTALSIGGVTQLVAAGGGGGGYDTPAGAGGGLVGERYAGPQNLGGYGGTQSAGGSGGNGGDGSLGQGGAGTSYAGGGGGGYYGGEGGGFSGYAGGGGGGSSFIDGPRLSNGLTTAGAGVTPGGTGGGSAGQGGLGGVSGSGAQPGQPGRLVFGVNAAPNAVDDSGSTNWMTPLALDPRVNDSDPEGTALTVTAVTTPTSGSASVVNGGAAVTYTPQAQFTGAAPFTYTVRDAAGLTSTATITITVSAPPNTDPIAAADARSVRQNGSATFDPRVNDSDPEFDPLTVATVGAPAHGQASVAVDGASVTYTPTPGYAGSDSFTYSVSDGRGGSAVGTVTITVTQNGSPVAAADTLSASAGSPKTFDPRTNDSDSDGDPLTITEVTQPSQGTVSIVAGGGSVTYTALLSYTGSDSFTYTVSDGYGGSAVATVDVTVGPPQRAFTISPAVGGKTTWNLDVDGPLVLATPGTWTLTASGQGNFVAKLWGGGGGGGHPSRSQTASGGGGGFATGTVAFQSGETLTLLVGGGGGANGVGGSGGGGAATANGTYGGGGGRSELAIGGAVQLVAGGGGGGGYDYAGGAGGGVAGGRNQGDGGGGYGGTQSAGGAGGGTSPGGSGSAGQGGASTYHGGGGGGGYFGGGGAGTTSGYGNGGGGGSSYVDGARVTGGSTTGGSGATAGGNGDPQYASGAGQGGAGSTGAAGAAGGTGRVVLN